MTSSLMTRPFRQIASLGKPFDHIWDDFRQMAEEAFPGFASGSEMFIAPSVDLAETDKAVEVRVDLPGLNAKDIDVKVIKNVLTISGERKEEKEEKGKTYFRAERRLGRFSRSLTLPAAIAEDEVVADFKDGVLTVTLPKTVESKARKIAVKS